MKFAFVFDGLGYGGIERVGVDYCNALVSRGHDVTVINLTPAKNEFVKQLSDNVSYITRYFPRALAPERYNTLVKRAAWGRFVYPLAYSLFTIVVMFKRLVDRRALADFDVAIAFSGHYNDLTFVGLKSILARNRIAWLHGSINSYALISSGYLNLYKYFDGLVTLCDDGVEEFEYSHSYLKYQIRKIYNPINVADDVAQADIDLVKGKYGDFALMVARLDYPHKDPFTVIEAIKQVNQIKNKELNLVIVGDGPDRQKVEKFIVSQGMQDKVYLAGYQSNPAPFYAACSLVVHASAGTEGLPTVILEGMAHKKPIVATDVRTGPKEILGYNEFGLLCKPKDPDDMARQIGFVIGDKERYRYYANKSAERVQDFAADRALSELLNYVNEMANNMQEDRCEHL